MTATINQSNYEFIIQTITSIEKKLDLLLARGQPSDRPLTDASETDNEDWIEQLDGITKFNLERGYTTKEEVRRGLKEGY